MNHPTETEEESYEQMFAEVAAHLVYAEEILLPRLEAKVRDVRDICKKAYDALSRVEHRVLAEEARKK